jgi:hypothetical protein
MYQNNSRNSRRLLALFVFIASSLAWPQSKTAEGARFNQCFQSLDPETLADPGFHVLLDDLRLVPNYKRSVWNVNHKYQKGAFNIIIPRWDEGPWPGPLCGDLPREPADCVTSPKERFIICNPAVGRQLASPLLQSGIASVEEEYGSHFILLTLLGHELGHIRLGKGKLTQHLIRFRSTDGLKCYKRPQNAPPTEEEKADQIGTSIACAALQRRPDRKDLPTSAEDIISLMTRLEDHLDSGYFAIDDLCTDDEKYPSISKRKQRFSDKYFSCFYSSGYETLRLLNRSSKENLDDLENWLISRQRSGHIASGSYGIRPLNFSYSVWGAAPNRYFSFDSSDKESSFWLVTGDTSEKLDFFELLNWNTSGITVHVDKDGAARQRWLLTLDQLDEATSPTAIDLVSECDGNRCSARSQHEKKLADGARLFVGESGSVAEVTRTDFRVFRSVDELFTAGEKEPRVHGFNKGTDELMLAFDSSHGLIFVRNAGGLYNAAAFNSERVAWKALLMLPQTAGTLESATMQDGHVLLTFSNAPLEGLASLELWDCPAAPFFGREDAKVNCDAYVAPQEIIAPAALTTRDFASLDDTAIEPDRLCSGDLVVHHRGWLWLVDRTKQRQDLLLADGLVSCDSAKRMITTFRARRIDHLELRMTPLAKAPASLSIMNATGPPTDTHR